MKKSENKAFTIVELMIVVVIIGILAAIIIPTVTDAITKAKVAEGKSNARNITTILYSEAVFQNRSYFEAYELDNIVSQAGYSLKSKTSEYRYWYDKDTNSMQYISLKEAFPKSGSAMNGVTYADSMKNSIEALSDAFPSYLYVDTYDDGITNLIYTVRNLPALARENNGVIDLSAIIENMDSILNDAINGLGNNADYNIETIKNHANNFTTDKTLYVDNNGIYTKAYALSKEDLSTAYEINGQKCVIDIANVVFNPQVTIIPNAVIIAKENNIDIEINIKVDIEIPDSVVLIQNGAFSNIASCQTITMKSNIAYDNDAFSTTAKQNISTRKENDNYTIYRIESGVITYTNMEARLNNGTVKKTNNITLSEGKFILDNTVIDGAAAKDIINKYLIPNMEFTNIDIPFEKIINAVIRSSKADGYCRYTAVLIDTEMNCYKIENIGYLTDVNYNIEQEFSSNNNTAILEVLLPEIVSEFANYNNITIKVEYSPLAVIEKEVMGLTGKYSVYDKIESDNSIVHSVVLNRSENKSGNIVYSAEINNLSDITFTSENKTYNCNQLRFNKIIICDENGNELFVKYINS